MWTAKTIKILPHVLEAHPKSRFLMLTLTARNCSLDDLRSQLKEMHHAWTKLVKRKEWKVEGWIRTTEVTRGKDDSAHPHYHCLLMVTSTYFRGDHYVSHDRWVEIWRDCLKIDYDPWVDIRTVKAKTAKVAGEENDPIVSALLEVVKYAVKPSDVLRGGNGLTPASQVLVNQEWLLKLTDQLHGLKKIATGGVLKQFFKVLEDEPEDLIHVDETGEVEPDSESPRVAFDWHERNRKYTAATS